MCEEIVNSANCLPETQEIKLLGPLIPTNFLMQQSHLNLNLIRSIDLLQRWFF
jgi:hypothetical protein